MSKGRKKYLFAGDVMIGRMVNEALQREPPGYPWGNTLALFREAAWRFCNLECVLADSWNPASLPTKAFHFRSDAKNAAVLQAAGIDAVSLANNHTLDFGQEALTETLDTLDRVGISHSGAGRDIGAASRPAICQVESLKVAVISFTDNEPDWEAGLAQAGIFYVPINPDDPRVERLLQIIHTTSADADLVFVSAHWGPNWGHSPPKSHIPFSHALINAGADVVIGHSPHIFQGIEIFHDCPIIYSAGDYIDDYAVDPGERNDESFIFVFETDGEGIRSLKLYPTLIRACQARLATGDHALRLADKMTKLCLEFETSTRWHDDECCLEIGGGD
jgi:poly-gamma-glutamate capsule biosynthesis protein CapA/YwtB (metallophosphatase superfamily)